MDHRWDELLRNEHMRRLEQGRYGGRRIEEDDDVDRRDRIARALRRPNRSPWDIGAAHWNQRDLYTTNARIDDPGYARGPAFHPEIGSYAYAREDVYEHELSRHRRPPALRSDREPTIYEREAWPWLQYEPVEPVWWANLRDYAKDMIARLVGGHRAREPMGWRRADESIREEICELLARRQDLDASDIDVLVKEGEVTLVGTVQDRRQKRLAAHLVERVYGVLDVHNELEVKRRGAGGGFGFAFAGRY